MRTTLALFAALSCTSAAYAQTEGGPPKVQDIQMVERGFFVETDVGLAVLVSSIDGVPLAPLGMSTSVLAGYDVTPFFSLSLGATALLASGKDEVNQPPASDLVWLSPILRAQLAVLTTERNFLWARAQAGFALGVPGEVGGRTFGGNGPTFGASLVYEHFTRLRHFSIGAQAGVVVMLEPGVAIGVQLSPTLKYTF